MNLGGGRERSSHKKEERKERRERSLEKEE
jgi:hypothetical protein